MIHSYPSDKEFFRWLMVFFPVQSEVGSDSAQYIIHLIENQLANAPTLATIGKELGMSQGALTQILKRQTGKNYSELLLEYLKEQYPGLYFVSSTTKVLTDFTQFEEEIRRKDFRYVVPDFRLNKAFDKLNTLSQAEKDKVEFLCNECCWFGCRERKACYETVSRKNLGENCPEHHCKAPEGERGYLFSKAIENPGFIGINDIRDIYLPMGFSNFKIEGRGLGSALILEFLLYYMIKPEYQIHVREKIYLDSMLDLF